MMFWVGPLSSKEDWLTPTVNVVLCMQLGDTEMLQMHKNKKV